jgi:metal-responsive CopG/Arc/MetJ family transcriptional regulator
MASHTIKVTGVSDELLRLLDDRIQAQHATGRAEYIRELIRKDVLANGSLPGGRTFRQIVAPLHEATPPEESEAESAQFVDDVIAQARRERREKLAPGEGR